MSYDPFDTVPEDWPDYYQQMLDAEVDDDGIPEGGHSDRQQRLHDLKKTLDRDWRWWIGDKKAGTHGTWVSNEEPWRQPDRKGRIIDRYDPELKHAWRVPTKDGEWFGGVRPSKRKSVK